MKIAFLGLFLFLVGCSSSFKHTLPTAQPAAPAVTAQETVPSSADRWSAKGRLAVMHGKKGGNASFIWQQLQDRYQLRMHGPFGAGSVLITGTPHEVFAQEANGKKHQAGSPEQLMQRLVGWHLPLSGLRYWIRGMPIPGVAVSAKRSNREGFLTHLVQSGWTIHYSEYKDALPKKIELHHPKLKIKLIITAWGE